MTQARRNTGWNPKLISPADFYSCEAEKTKLNWFCFEYALELQRYVYKDRKLTAKLKRKKVDDAKIAKFCIHYAKDMKGPILRQVSGESRNIHISYHEIERFFPSIGHKLADDLLKAAFKAWDFLTAQCVSCPTRCISEKEKRAPMFDDPYYYE